MSVRRVLSFSQKMSLNEARGGLVGLCSLLAAVEEAQLSGKAENWRHIHPHDITYILALVLEKLNSIDAEEDSVEAEEELLQQMAKTSLNS